jgi:hypothetical protein
VTHVEVTYKTYTAVIIHKICDIIKQFPDYLSETTAAATTTTPTSHQCCPSQSSPLAPLTTIWCSRINCGLKLDKRNWQFCMNHGYIIKLQWFLGQPLNPHLITCDYLQKNPSTFQASLSGPATCGHVLLLLFAQQAGHEFCGNSTHV